MQNLPCPCCGSNQFAPYLQTKDFFNTQEDFSINTCQICNLGVTTPIPSNDVIAKYYQSDEYISHSNKPRSIINFIYLIVRRFTLRWKYKLLPNKTKSLLDYGCGTGHFLHFAQSKGIRISGVEPNPHARHSANQLLKHPSVYPSLAEIQTKFEVITLWHVLEHIIDLRTEFHQILERLEPGGYLYLALPNYQSYDATHYGRLWAGFDIPRHIWHFTPKSIAYLTSRHHLSLIDRIPMKLDAFYVSMLSEKYRGTKNTLSQLIKGIIIGAKSNFKARTTQYSSIIYVLQKTPA